MSQLQDFSYSEFDKKLIVWLTISPGFGRKTIRRLLIYLKKHEHEIDDIWVFLSAKRNDSAFLLKLNKFINSGIYSIFEQETCLFEKENKNNNIRVVSFWESEYPSLLLETDDFPLVLFMKGAVSVLSTECISVVGTRRITGYGKQATQKIVEDLVYSGYTIVSGGMYGVDFQAHQVALESNGKTIVVLGHGICAKISDYYLDLHEKVIQHGGVVISEYPLYTQANKGTFRERNRIVAGLSRGTVVIEAAVKSGTHITVGCALEAGREVFAVPGSIFNPFSLGTKDLVNQGAILVNSGADIVAEFQKQITIPDSRVAVSDLNLSEIENKIVTALVLEPRSVNELATEFKIEIQELLTILSMLELENIVHSKAGVWHCVLLYSGYSK